MIHPPMLCVGGRMEGGPGARVNWVVLLVILRLHNFSECQILTAIAFLDA